VGWPNWFGIFVVTAIVGGFMALILVAVRKRVKSTFWNVGFIINEMKSGRPAYVGKEELDVHHPKALVYPWRRDRGGDVVLSGAGRHYAG